MVKQHIKMMIESCPFQQVVIDKLWAAIEDVQFVWLENPAELMTYEPLAHSVKAASTHVLVIQNEDHVSVMALLNPEEAGLSGLVGSQLGYVPKSILLEWVLTSDTAGWREAIVCLGHHMFDEPLMDTKIGIATVSGTMVASEFKELLMNDPNANRISLFATYMGLRSRTMLIDRKLSPTDYSVRVLHAGHYGLQ